MEKRERTSAGGGMLVGGEVRVEVVEDEVRARGMVRVCCSVLLGSEVDGAGAFVGAAVVSCDQASKSSHCSSSSVGMACGGGALRRTFLFLVVGCGFTGFGSGNFLTAFLGGDAGGFVGDFGPDRAPSVPNP